MRATAMPSSARRLRLRQLMGERALHDRERRLGAADLVAPPARLDHARSVLRTFAKGDDVGGEPAHRLEAPCATAPPTARS